VGVRLRARESLGEGEVRAAEGRARHTTPLDASAAAGVTAPASPRLAHAEPRNRTAMLEA
jgi:hypothetical protein